MRCVTSKCYEAVKIERVSVIDDIEMERRAKLLIEIEAGSCIPATCRVYQLLTCQTVAPP